MSRPGGYAYGDRIITGFSLTHLSGAGCVSFGNVSFMPASQPVTSAPSANGSPYSQRFSHAEERATPGSYAVRLGSGIKVQLVAAQRSGLATFEFPRGRVGTVVVNSGSGAGARLNTDGALHESLTVLGGREVDGEVTAGQFCGLSNRYRLYFAAIFKAPFATYRTWQGRDVVRGRRQVNGRQTGAFLDFDTSRDRIVEAKVGLSYVSVENARLNIGADFRSWDEQRARSSAERAWNRLLGRIVIRGGSNADRVTFYTALYHSFLHPNTFSDVNGQYIGFNGRVHVANHRIQYANFSGWDIYRSEVQLLAWLLPRQTGDMMESLVADAEQGGWLPKWPVANEETGEMNGDSADPILANAYAFGARTFDVRTALHFMVKGATHLGSGRAGYVERPGLRQYLALGYIPGYNPAELRPYGAAATTLEYAVDDFAIAQLAKASGDRTGSRHFLDRSENWQHLFNPATGLLEPRMAPTGSFPVPFNPRSMDGYTEGNALQYTWMVPQNLPGLFQRMGGTGVVIPRLDSLFRRLNGGPTDPYDWAGNEPGFELPWEYDFAGRPWRTQAVVRRIMLTRYTTTVGGLPGNDDLGALSSWYVWAALGLYPEIPGVAGLTLGSPLFPHTLIEWDGGKILQIDAAGAADDRPYVRMLSFDGHPYRHSWLRLSALGRVATLYFRLSNGPNRRWVK